MRMNFRVDRVDGGHSTVSLFVDGAKTGAIVLRNKEIEEIKAWLENKSHPVTVQLTFSDTQYERTL